MIFSSFEFIFVFLPICLLIQSFLLKKIRIYNIILLIFSLFFYYRGEKGYTAILLFSSIIDFICGHYIEKAQSQEKRYQILRLSIISNLTILIMFKYASFFTVQLNSFFEILNIAFRLEDPKIHLPLGISFFTFQSMSYSIDVYRRDVKASKSFSDFFMYVSMFPQLVAGPIVRYSDIVDQIRNKNFDIKGGIERFVIGLAKKVLIADQVAFYADLVFDANVSGLSSTAAWFGLLAYTVQIYFDFSGYSDMAIGLGKLFGFQFPENFKHPYISKDIQEFWRRWHISLSTWFRDYLYIPLGGNRKGKTRTYINQIIVFFLCGLWHGASWNFVIWGLFHGLLLTAEKLFGYQNMLIRIPLLGRVYTMLMVMIGWVFFRSRDLTHSIAYLKQMFSFEFSNLDLSLGMIGVLLAAVVMAGPWGHSFYKKSNNSIQYFVLILLMVLCSLTLSVQSFSPFIYFRF